jgi:hypothetical protein
VVEASKLKISLRTRPHFGGPRRAIVDVSTIQDFAPQSFLNCRPVRFDQSL